MLVLQIDRLPSQEALAEVKETIQGLNAEAHFIETVRCKIDLGQILNRGIFDPQRNASGGDANGAVKASENLLPESRQEVLDLGGRAVKAKSLKSRPTKHKHDTNIRTLRLELPGFLHLDRYIVFSTTTMFTRQKPSVLRSCIDCSDSISCSHGKGAHEL